MDFFFCCAEGKGREMMRHELGKAVAILCQVVYFILCEGLGWQENADMVAGAKRRLRCTSTSKRAPDTSSASKAPGDTSGLRSNLWERMGDCRHHAGAQLHHCECLHPYPVASLSAVDRVLPAGCALLGTPLASRSPGF